MVLIYQLQKKVLGFIGIGAMPSLRFSATSSISPSLISITDQQQHQYHHRQQRNEQEEHQGDQN